MKKQNTTKKARITLSAILVQAMTDKVLFKAIRKGPIQTRALLARRGFSLSTSAQKQLAIVAPSPKPTPVPPPPPAWRVVYPIANAILVELTARIDKLEKTVESKKGRKASTRR